ncbi:MAG TPA: hypothetical protein VGB39_02390 [Sphingomicrobium sp.]
MFGRRKEPPAAPPPGGQEPFPIDKMDAALDGAIRLFTRVLDNAGVDPGQLAIRGAVPAGVTKALAECTTYRGEDDGGLTYLALGLTADFKEFMYPPHCRLFFIINSTGICEDQHAQSILGQIAARQLPGPLLDAHLMRVWIRYILPTPQALKGGAAAMDALHQNLMRDLMTALNRMPQSMASGLDDKAIFRDWAGGFPGTIGRPLDDSVPRMNGLPVTPFINDVLIRYLADVQAGGLRDEARRASG